jgi:hypothetical protein
MHEGDEGAEEKEGAGGGEKIGTCKKGIENATERERVEWGE